MYDPDIWIIKQVFRATFPLRSQHFSVIYLIKLKKKKNKGDSFNNIFHWELNFIHPWLVYSRSVLIFSLDTIFVSIWFCNTLPQTLYFRTKYLTYCFGDQKSKMAFVEQKSRFPGRHSFLEGLGENLFLTFSSLEAACIPRLTPFLLSSKQVRAKLLTFIWFSFSFSFPHL